MLDTAPPSAKAHEVANAAALVTLLSVLSPTAGLFLEVCLAWKFGASGTVDAFRTAYLPISFATQLLMALLLPHIVVPLIASYRARGDEQAGWRLALSFGQIVTLASALLTAWVFVHPASLAHLLAPGLTGDSLEQTFLLLRVFSIACTAVVWCGVLTGVLYVHHVFALPLVSQLICNLLIAAGVLVYGNRGTLGIAIGAACGFGIMLVLHAHALLRIARLNGISLRAALAWAPAREVAALFARSAPLLVLAFVGIASTTILNSAVSRLPAGSLALYGYATKLVIIVLFASGALATVMFPIFSDASARSDRVQFSRSCERGIRMILMLTVPLAAVIYAIREPLVRALFDRGALSPADVTLVAHLFAILLCHTPATGLGALLLKIYFAEHDTRTLAFAHVLLPFALYLLIPPAIAIFGGPGILVAYDVVAWAAPMFLLSYGIARYRITAWQPLARFCMTLAALSTLAALAAAIVNRMFHLLKPPHFFGNVADVALASAAALFTVILVSRQFAITEVREIETFLAWRFRLPSR